MTSLPPPSPAAPAIQTRAQLDAVLENIVHLRSARDELRREQENEINTVRQRYRVPLAEIDHYLELETGWAEAWARANPGAFAADRSLACVHATVGFQAEPTRIERASRRWTWSRIALTLAEFAWGQRYLRVPEPEVDKEALLADLPRLSTVDLRDAGIRVVEGERFYITPHSEAGTAAGAPAESPWREAA